MLRKACLVLLSTIPLFLVVLGLQPLSLEARVTGTAPSSSTPDKWCVGKSSAEVCVDHYGNFVPTTDAYIFLGSATLSWAGLYVEDITVDDDLTVTDDLTVNGDTVLGDAAADTLDLNVTSVTVNATATGLYYGTSTANGSQILRLDGSNLSVSVGQDVTPDAALEVTPKSQGYSLKISSQNGSTDLLAVNANTSEVELGVALLIYARTSAQIAAITPRAQGLVIVNTTLNTLCVSSGTTIGSYVLGMSTATTATLVPCYGTYP